ncbi:MAG: hypothetical protein RL699_1812, partial [Bacteroidota bacterium]
KTDAVTTIDGLNVNYTDQDLPFGFKILTVNYYDTYDFPIAEPINFTSTLDNPYYNNTTRKPTGLLTGTWVRVLKELDGPINGEFKYILYNYRGQAILEHQTNFLGGFTRTETRLDFTGKPTLIKEVHKYNSTAELITVQNAFVYTPQGLIETHKHKINNEEWQTLAENKYNELGQLESKKTGATESLDFIQQVDYTYNIRGWLTGINAINSLTMPNQPLDFFAFKLNYDTTEDAVPNATAYYNGNISETQWRTSSDNTKRKYSYQYDSLNRLQFAVYQKPEANFPIRNSYNESIDYDVFGNIKRLIRNGNADVIDLIPNEIDSLAYDYRNNRLQGIRDNSNSPLGFKDIELNNTNDYDYDNNGNLKVDFNKKISQILYNHLNLPVEIIFEGSSQKKITYTYTATGQKIQKTILAPSMVEKTTHYLNGLQYFQSRLQFIPTSQGYVNATTIRGNYRFNYVYNYLDHLGNVRLSYGRDPQAHNEIKILEENHYYPYGLKHTNYNANLNAYKKDNNDQVQLTGTGLSADLINKYKFNGMEYQDELGLNLYDMDMRDYDPAIGRWTGIDPVTHFPQSPYNAFDGNPVTFADPSGADGVVYGMAGQSAWSNPNPRGADTFGNANYMPNSFADNTGAGWGDGGLLRITLDWDKMDMNTDITFSKNGIHLSSDNEARLPGIVLPTLTVHKRERLTKGLLEQHYNNHSPYIHVVRDMVKGFAGGLQDGGDIIAGVGYALTLTGVFAEVGIPLAALGNGMSAIGSGLEIGTNLHSGYYSGSGYGAAAQGAAFLIGGRQLGKQVSKIQDLDDLAKQIIMQNMGLKIMGIERYINYK